MNVTDIIVYVLIGLAAGVLGGIFGLGGGLIVVPALIFISGFTQLKAQGTSLAVMLPPVGLLAFMTYYRNGNVDLKAGIIICITLFVGAFFGARMAQSVNPDLLRKGFAIFMILVSLKMLSGK
ncbi:MAG TPA: sulfite exporter TauE/SafE family protein [Syntrophomonadaceae bacterium]|nr:sulfite exporter TauE/SafE family protein [Syntrophomonadaceae bacterium]